ncbi:MAG TPA: hypothetical protein VKT49_06110 [Bryobacteraceae bacterium]|nr:hypothetical protein [Bryobacteraceae bacterium]
MRSVLVAALASCTESPFKSQARRFLGGLSRDELQFIADYLGASILDSTEPGAASRPELTERIAEFQRCRAGAGAGSNSDLDHKTILLLEFLCRSGLGKAAVAVRATHA